MSQSISDSSNAIDTDNNTDNSTTATTDINNDSKLSNIEFIEPTAITNRATATSADADPNAEPELTPAELKVLKRSKVPLPAGHSQMHWAVKSNKIIPPKYGHYTAAEVALHNTVNDCWTILNGRVYNITSYLPFHPGGIDQLMRGSGRDCSKLFNQIHSFVNYQFLLGKCEIGILTK